MNPSLLNNSDKKYSLEPDLKSVKYVAEEAVVESEMLLIQYKKIQHKIYNSEKYNTNLLSLFFYICLQIGVLFCWFVYLTLGFIVWIANPWKRIFHNLITSFFFLEISVLLCWFTLLFKFPFILGQPISLICSLFCLSQVYYGPNPIFFSSVAFCNFVLSSFFCLLILLWFTVWHQYFSLLILAHCWCYHWIRTMHPAKQSILKFSSVLIRIILQVSFSRWSTNFDQKYFQTSVKGKKKKAR